MLYNNGYASVDIDGKVVFQGDITKKNSGSARLSYYNIKSGEKILLN